MHANITSRCDFASAISCWLVGTMWKFSQIHRLIVAVCMWRCHSIEASRSAFCFHAVSYFPIMATRSCAAVLTIYGGGLHWRSPSTPPWSVSSSYCMSPRGRRLTNFSCSSSLDHIAGRHVVSVVSHFSSYPRPFRILQGCREEAYASGFCCLGVSPCDRD